MRWLLVLLICVLVFNRFGGWMTRLGLGRLPGDLRLRLFGREFLLPIGSSLVLMLVASVIAWIR
jgi:hypothetical protein